jgi:hypothetical protein
MKHLLSTPGASSETSLTVHASQRATNSKLFTLSMHGIQFENCAGCFVVALAPDS